MNPTNPCRGHAAESERAEGIEAAVRELRLFIMGESLQTRKEASKHLETLVKQIACGQAPGISGLLAEAHDASLDKDHMGCRAILKQCMRILEDAEVGRLPDGATVIDSGFRFDGQLQQHIPRLVIEFEPVPVGHPSDAKGWKDRDAVASMVAAALSAHADTQPAKVPSNQLAEDFRHFFKRVIAVIPFENYREIGELGGAILEQLKAATHYAPESDEAHDLRASLTNSQNRLFDVLVGDDGQAWKEAERYLERERPDLYGALNQRVQRGAALDVERLSNVIRSADGANNLGAGALAEKIVEAVGTPAEDTKLLEWMQFHGARVAWANDDEFCYVTWSDRDDTYRTALFSDWREAIRAAMRGDARPAVDRLAPATPAEIFDAAQRLIARAQHAGVVLTIETVSVPPLAMGRYVMRAATRPARQPAEKQA